MSTPRPAPILVTGLPRSGTTWLARQLATARNTALPGREPMNPREGQFGLGGSLTAWTRLDPRPDDRQARLLRRVYRGWEPREYGRYGERSWAAPLPWVRVIVKDPFALLSLPTVTALTGARSVVLFRHPAALLASYRRMGWRPDVEEIRELGLGSLAGVPELAGTGDEVGAMGWFWAACYAAVLRDLATVPDALVVDHAALAAGGESALRSLAADLGLAGVHAAPPTPSGRASHRRRGGSAPQLHRLDRTPAEVAAGWRNDVAPEDVERLEALTAPVLRDLAARTLRFRRGEPTGSEVTP